jgi:chitin disaccharide deacetylase
MTTQKYLIVNADDFGRSPGVNRGVILAHEQGIVTSASFMVRWPAAAAAAGYARAHPRLSPGLHVDLGEWAYRQDSWVQLDAVVANQDPMAVARAAADQLAAFRYLVGRNPSHLDSHQHVHRNEPARSILLRMARELGVPLRLFSPGIRYVGDFYGQSAKGWPCTEAISVAGLLRILSALAPGVTELGCHPGDGEDFDSMYIRERSLEVKTLCDPEIRAALAASTIELCSFDTYDQVS